jgi:uncharacterized protein YciI
MTAPRAAAVLAVALALAACATQPPATTSAAPTPPQAAAIAPAAPTPDVAPPPAVAPTTEVVPTTNPAPKPPHVYWAVRLAPGPKWIAGKPADDQPGIEEHVANLGKWNERGLVYLGGPFLDGTGGMTVLRAKNAKEAKALVDEDPCVRSGLLVPEIHPWLCVYRTGD